MDGIEGFRCYGEQTLVLLESFVESKGKVDPEDFARRLEAKFGKAPTKWMPWTRRKKRCHVTSPYI